MHYEDMVMSEQEIKDGLYRIESYLVEKYKERCPVDVYTLHTGLCFSFSVSTGMRLEEATYSYPIYKLSLGQLCALAQALPDIEKSILEAEVIRASAITKTLNLIKDFESKQNGL